MAIKQYHYFGSIKKYTKALLDTFNDICTERVLTDGTRVYKPVPITFASKDPAYLLSDMDTDQLLSGNTNFLPRMSLGIETMEPLNTERGMNRMLYVNNNKFIYNSFGIEMMYSLILEAKSLTELTEMLEQILPAFNPHLALRVNELDNLSEPTTIKVEYMMAEITLPTTNEDHNTRICSAQIRLKLHGNLYPPITDPQLIKHVKINMHSDKLTSTLQGRPNELGRFGQIYDTDIRVVNVLSEETQDNKIKLIPVIEDPENKLFAVIYNIVYHEEYAHLEKQLDNSALLTCDKRAIVSIQCIDKDGKQSNYIEVSVKRDDEGLTKIEVLTKTNNVLANTSQKQI